MDEDKDIEVRGFPGQNDKSYICWHSRTCVYKEEDEDEESECHIHVTPFYGFSVER